MDDTTRGLSKLLANRMIQRRDVKALQASSGAYRPVRSPFTMRDLGLHLAGSTTYGHYLVDHDGHCRMLAFDIDFDDSFSWRDKELNPREVFGTDHPARRTMNKTIRAMADGLAWRLKRTMPDLIVSTAFSGSKGLHVYGCFTRPTTADAARDIATDVLDGFGCFEATRGSNFYRHTNRDIPLTIETFPKQEKISRDGFGNLLKLPLGTNRKTGRRAFFYDVRSPIQELTPYDSVAALLYGTVIPQ